MNEETYCKIVSHIRDEIADVDAYRALASECDGYTRLVIERIVQDEESHARYLAKALHAAGRDMPADAWNDYQEMERSFRHESER